MARYTCGAFTCGYTANTVKQIAKHREQAHPTLGKKLFIVSGGIVY